MPRRTPGYVFPLCPLDEANVPIEDGSAPKLGPPLRLGGFANAGGPQEQHTPALVLNGGAVELEHLATHGVGVEELQQKHLGMFHAFRGKDGRVFPRGITDKDAVIAHKGVPYRKGDIKTRAFIITFSLIVQLVQDDSYFRFIITPAERIPRFI